jgi:hypothetical protein
VNLKNLAAGIVIFAFIGIISSCKEEKSADQKIFDTLSPIEGTWVMAFDSSSVIEIWKRVNDSKYEAKSYEVNGNDSLLSETIELTLRDEGIYYAPVVFNQNDGQPVEFKLTSGENGNFVFENPKHDFPTKITYHFVDSNHLKASVSGMIRGEMRSLDLDYVRQQ